MCSGWVRGSSEPCILSSSTAKAVTMGKRHLAPIIGQHVRLRLLTEADLPMTLAWRNQAHIRKWFVHSDVIVWEQHQLWCTRYFARDNDFIFIIEETRQLRRPV